MANLDFVAKLVQTVESETCACFEPFARERMERRDEDDWPILASAHASDCPMWTEDTDFFGCGRSHLEYSDNRISSSPAYAPRVFSRV